jgi:transposase
VLSWFLPPYSPDFSPMERMWSKIKHYLKKFGPLSGGAFHDALLSALSELQDEEFEEWYDDCGYQFT